MSPIEHYFENLLIRGSDNKGEPNKNALSKEVQEAIEICAYYIKSTQLYRNANDINSEKVAMLEELKKEIIELPVHTVSIEGLIIRMDIMPSAEDVSELIQQKINALKGE